MEAAGQIATKNKGAVVVLTCCAPYGVGGLGRTLSDTADALCADGQPFRVYATSVGTGGSLGTAVTCVRPRLPDVLARIPPIRFDMGWQQHLAFEHFDRAVAKRLDRLSTPPIGSLVGSAGQALHTFKRALSLGCPRLELVSATGHLGHVWRQHRLAARRYSIERDWLNRAHLERALAEYAMADVIHVGTAYAWDTFVREGVPPSKLRRLSVAADGRFTPATHERSASNDVFRIVYTGALSVVKGVPLLLDAFEGLTGERAELTLVGWTGSRGMRKFIEARCAQNAQIRVAPGDPLPHLQKAQVYVHPSYQDGFGYAVAEALACGVPVVVTEDTGAKELVIRGVNGDIVPTDSVDAIRAALVRRYGQWRERRHC
jgi:glycosyltransferase involved in cell wall biosynthesis